MNRIIIYHFLGLALVIITFLSLGFKNNFHTNTKSNEIDWDCSCQYNGFKLNGRIKFVESFPDIKVKIVESFPDIKVKFVTAFPDDCGEWQIVESFPDIKVQIVESFPDIKIKYVDAFPGKP